MSSTLFVSFQIAKILFDSGLTHSFCSVRFAKRSKSPESLNFDLSMATPLGGSVIVDRVVKTA